MIIAPIIGGGLAYIGELLVANYIHNIQKIAESKERSREFKKAYNTAVSNISQNNTLDKTACLELENILTIDWKRVAKLQQKKKDQINKCAQEIENSALFNKEYPNVVKLAEMCRYLAETFQKPLTVKDYKLEPTLKQFILYLQELLVISGKFPEVHDKINFFRNKPKATTDTLSLYKEHFKDQFGSLVFSGVASEKTEQRVLLKNIFVSLLVKSISNTVFEGSQQHDFQSNLPTPFHQVLDRHDHLVILGPPGSGKSTLLKYIALNNMKDTPYPIFIRARDIVDDFNLSQEQLIDFIIRRVINELSLEQALVSDLKDAVIAGRCCICIDGLDEIVNKAKREQLIERINMLAKKYNQNRILVTSREVGHNSALWLQQFEQKMLQSFQPSDKKKFLRRWFYEVANTNDQGEQLATTLFAEIESNSNLQQLSTNPFILTTIASIYKIGIPLPGNRAALFEKYMKWLIDFSRGGNYNELYIKNWLQLLQYVAHKMHTQQENSQSTSNSVTERKLHRMVAKRLIDEYGKTENEAKLQAKEFIKAAHTRFALFVKEGNKYAFSHQAVQEFLVARNIADQLELKDDEDYWHEIKDKLHHPHWRDVILLLFGIVNDSDLATFLVRKILEQTDEFEMVLRRHLFLAVDILAEPIKVAEDVKSEIINSLSQIITDHELQEHTAITVLSKLKGNPLAKAILINHAMNEANILDQIGGFISFGRFGERKTAIQYLLRIIEDKKIFESPFMIGDTKMNDIVLWVIASAIADLGEVKEAVLLLQKCIHDASLSNATSIMLPMILLVELDFEAAISSLHKIVRDDDESRVAAAMQAFSLDAENEKVVSILVFFIKDDSLSLKVQELALNVLGLLFIQKKITMTALLKLARDSQLQDEIRANAFQLFQFQKVDENVFSILVNLIQDNQESVFIRISAAMALENISGELNPFETTKQKVIYACLRIIENKDEDIGLRCSSGLVLAKIVEANEAIPVLLKFVDETQIIGGIRLKLLYEFRNRGMIDEAVRSLFQSVQDEFVNVTVREVAAEAISSEKENDELVVTALKTIAQNEQNDQVLHRMRLAASQLLADIGLTNNAVNFLINLAQDKRLKGGLRIEAVEALVTLDKISEAIRVLYSMAQDDNFSERSQVVRMLRDLGMDHQFAQNILLELVMSEQIDGSVHSKVVKSLGVLAQHHKTILNTMRNLVKNGEINIKIRQKAFDELEELIKFEPEIIDDLFWIADEPLMDFRMRQGAVRMIGKVGQVNSQIISKLLGMAQNKDLDRKLRHSAYRSLKQIALPNVQLKMS